MSSRGAADGGAPVVKDLGDAHHSTPIHGIDRTQGQVIVLGASKLKTQATELTDQRCAVNPEMAHIVVRT
jgi:hypothetical protein